MKSIKKTLVLFPLIFFSFFSMPLQSVTQEELQEFAIKNNDSELIEILLKYWENKNHPILNQAMNAKDYFTVFMLIEYGFDINSRIGTGSHVPFDVNLNFMAFMGNMTCLSVIEKAIVECELNLVEYFLSKEADPTRFCYFYQEPQDPITKQKYKIEFRKNAVYDAIMLDRLDVLILFAQYGVNFNKICYDEKHGSRVGGYTQTPLQVSVAHKKKDIANFLLSLGVEI